MKIVAVLFFSLSASTHLHIPADCRHLIGIATVFCWISMVTQRLAAFPWLITGRSMDSISSNGASQCGVCVHSIIRNMVARLDQIFLVRLMKHLDLRTTW